MDLIWIVVDVNRLYTHFTSFNFFLCLKEHQKGAGEGNLQKTPWELEEGRAAPWEGDKVSEKEDQEFNSNLKEVYELHKNMILEGNLNDDIAPVYNFPVDNTLSLDQIMDQAEEIFDNQKMTFKLNFALGLILYNVNTRKFRYFKPYFNEFVLSKPAVINSVGDLDQLRDRIQNLEIGEYMLQQRPDTAWKPIMVTNVRWFVTKTGFLLGTPVLLPDFITLKKSVISLVYGENKMPYRDNLCLFRCLALHENNFHYSKRRVVTGYFEKFKEFMIEEVGPEWNINEEEFEGLDINLLYYFELCFRINVNVFELQSKDSAIPKYLSRCKFKKEKKLNTMNVNMYENHLSYIKSINSFCGKFECDLCKRIFTKNANLLTHRLRCEKASHLKFPGKFYSRRSTIFEQIGNLGFKIPTKDCFFPHFAVFDYGSILEKMELEETNKLTHINKHKPISVSICSNVENFTEAKTFVDPNEEALVRAMLEHLLEIQKLVSMKMKEKFLPAFTFLEGLIEKWTLICNTSPSKPNTSMKKFVLQVHDKFSKYCSRLPVLGFNSSRYDINLIKTVLTRLIQIDNDDTVFTVKRANSYCVISSNQFKFLDITHYLAPGYSYSDFLKSFNVPESKFFSPMNGSIQKKN